MVILGIKDGEVIVNSNGGEIVFSDANIILAWLLAMTYARANYEYVMIKSSADHFIHDNPQYKWIDSEIGSLITLNL